MALLEVRDLKTYFHTPDGRTVRAVDGVSFSLHRGEILGLIGESGCGKSTVALSLMRLLPPHAQTAGRVVLDGTDLMTLEPERMRRIRWRRLALVPQSAMNALNPVIPIGAQIAEAIVEHLGLARRDALHRARELLALVRIDPQRYHAYPHELSGGMRQRVAIAMALACNPDVLIADEATTGLDVITQAHIIGLLRELQERLGLSLLIISHDLPTVLEVCHRVAIMYAGQLVEVREAAALRRSPRHPYTRGLLAAFPPVLGPRRRAVSIPGGVADLTAPPPGCRFHPRCPCCCDDCRSAEPVALQLPDGWVACHLVDGEVGPVVHFAVEGTAAAPPGQPGNHEVLIAARGLRKEFARPQGLFRRPVRVTAVRSLDLAIRAGEVFGLIGESGCGKSTTARMLLGLEEPSGGSVWFGGRPVWGEGARLTAAELRQLRREMAIIFQDPYESLNPHMTVAEIVGEPLQVHRPDLPAAERRDRVAAALAAVDLQPHLYMDRYPHQLSGGQRQRVAIARALVLGPRFVAADEPTSMLDVSVRAGILDSLLRLRDERGLTYLFITHDLAAARYMCDRVGVMYNGQLVEMGPTEEVIRHSAHPYTRALVAVVADLPGFLRYPEQVIRAGEAGATAGPVAGCPFAARCPLATPVCHETPPPWRDLGAGHAAACHHIG